MNNRVHHSQQKIITLAGNIMLGEHFMSIHWVTMELPTIETMMTDARNNSTCSLVLIYD